MALKAALAAKKFEPVYGTMIRLAVATGLRQGELIALRWKDVNLSERVAHISRSYNVLDEETTTKTDKARDVRLIEDAGPGRPRGLTGSYPRADNRQLPTALLVSALRLPLRRGEGHHP